MLARGVVVAEHREACVVQPPRAAVQPAKTFQIFWHDKVQTEINKTCLPEPTRSKIVKNKRTNKKCKKHQKWFCLCPCLSAGEGAGLPGCRSCRVSWPANQQKLALQKDQARAHPTISLQKLYGLPAGLFFLPKASKSFHGTGLFLLLQVPQRSVLSQPTW